MDIHYSLLYLVIQIFLNNQFFIFPSLYEGFGIPILEAFANECPVCLSSASCFPEIARQGALYFDPLDKESIQETVRQVITDQSLSSKLVEEGRSRLTAF